jgi:uncharacterized protein YabE (DUF348 family)
VSLPDPQTTRTVSKFRRRLVGAAAAVILTTAVVAGTLVAVSKSVTITVDGVPTEVSTLASDVGGALASAGLAVTDRDSLAPALDQPVSDGSTVVLNRGRLVTVTIDGAPHELWTTARTVDAVLAQLGEDTTRLALSADRSRQIPLDGLALTASTLRPVTLTDGAGAPVQLTTAAKSVGELLTEKGVSIGALDTVVPDTTSAISDGLVITVTRTSVADVVETEPIAQPADVTVEDPALDRGTTTVTAQGAAGSAAVTYRVTSVNGAVTDKVETARTVTVPAVATQIAVGTKSTLRWEGNQVFFDDTEFGINWDGIAMCESTHNPKAINAYPSAGLPTYGLFQFDLPTWASVGGSGNPIDAAPEEQLMRAKLLYQKRGLEPWVCAYAA